MIQQYEDTLIITLSNVLDEIEVYATLKFDIKSNVNVLKVNEKQGFISIVLLI